MTSVEKCIKRIKCTHFWVKETQVNSRWPLNFNGRISLYMDIGRSRSDTDSIYSIFSTLTPVEQDIVRNANHGCIVNTTTIEYPV